MSPAVQLHVNPGDELPIYRQLVRQISDAIAGGRLDDGEQLPSHRDLATRLVIAPRSSDRPLHGNTPGARRPTSARAA